MSSTNGDRPAEHQARRPDGAVAGFSRLDVAGYILAFVLPVFGFVVGVVLWRRAHGQESRHGAWIIAISIVVGALFLGALIASSHIGFGEAE